MGSDQHDCNGFSAEAGLSKEQSFTPISLRRSNVIVNTLMKFQAEYEHRVEASQVITASGKYQVTKAQLLSSGSLFDEATPEQSFFSYSDDDNNEKEAGTPSVGDGYQVEVPTFLSDSEQYLSTHKFLDGLTEPVMRVQLKENNPKYGKRVCIDIEDSKRPAEFKRNRSSQFGHNERGSEMNTELAYLQPDWGEDSTLGKLGLKMEAKAPLHKMNICKSPFSVPDTRYKSWNDADMDSFLLGLYIFGKDFDQVKRFVVYKGMGDILSFYYGDFYRSNRHSTWSDCIKGSNKKRVWGNKLFSGWRQQLLLSCLLSHATEENRNKLLKVSKSFATKGISLEEYVFSLKAIVGLRKLGKAVGIGKGKKDLTGVCSSLKSKDIIKCLTGSFQLSRYQLNDIFWEAVWPRLLARGCHAEQRRNRRSVRSKNSFVFLKPDVKVFSREKLVKGEDFFDSASEVLRKVVSEPHLIRREKIRNQGVNEVIDCPLANSEEWNVPLPHNHGSFKSQHDICKGVATMVDTGSMHEGKSYGLRTVSDVLVSSEINSRLTCPKKENGTSDLNVLARMPCNDVDCSSKCGEKSSGWRRIKFVSKTLKLEATITRSIATSCNNIVNEQWKEDSNVSSDDNMHVLRNVASEPQLLHLEDEKIEIQGAKEMINCHLNCEENIHSSSQLKGTSDHNVSASKSCNVANTGSGGGEKSSGLKRIKLVSECSILKPTSKLSTATSCKDSVHEQRQEHSTVPSDDNRHVEDVNCEVALNIRNVTTSKGEHGKENSTISDNKETRKTIKLHFNRRACRGHSTTSAPIKSPISTSSTHVIAESLESKQLKPFSKLNSSSVSPCHDKEPPTSLCVEGPKNDAAAGTTEHQPTTLSRRKSTRNRRLTVKACEALSSGDIVDAGKRKRKARDQG